MTERIAVLLLLSVLLVGGFIASALTKIVGELTVIARALDRIREHMTEDREG
jgi:hypothetical protein